MGVIKKKGTEKIKPADLVKANRDDSVNLKEQILRIRNKQPLISEIEVSKNEVDISENKEAVKVDEPVIEKPIETEKPTEVVSEIPEIKPAENIAEKEGEKLAEKVAEKISMFSDMKKGTEQDTQQIDRLENIADDFLDDNFNENPEEDSLEVRKTNAKISAGIWVTVIDIGMMVGCLFLSNDFSDESQRKFSLITERKQAIKQSIYSILLTRKKKTNPMYSLVFAILGSYAPMFVIAFMNGKKKRDADKERKTLIAQTQTDQAWTPAETFGTNGAKSNADIVENFGGKLVPIKRNNNMNKGRHKIGCNFYNGNPCDCKQPNFIAPNRKFK